MFTRFSSTLRNTGKAAAFICLAILLPKSSAYAADVDALPDAADEVINVIGNLPTYHNRAIGGVVNIDRLDAPFTVSIDFDATPADSVGNLRELIWETGGSGIGIGICYEHPNTLVLRATSNRAEVEGPPILSASAQLTQEQIDAGELELAWTWQSNTRQEDQVISIIIDGAVAAIASKALYPSGTIDWSGSNGGSLSLIHI